MLSSWARAYAERWGLPEPALAELQEVLDAVGEGRVSAGDAPTVYLSGDDGQDGEDGDAVRGKPDPLDTDLPEAPAGPVRIPVVAGEVQDRYEDIGHIDTGGMGEVRRVWDYVLNRSLAMKILRADLRDREDLVARFKEEAEATAQLEHPAIVPIHDFGLLPDGRAWFTMKEIRGRTLLDVIDEVHGASLDGWDTGPTGWSLLRLVGVFHQVCEAIAYAHSRSVLHRDLKPTNIMVGAFGEVVVMDWGLAKVAHLPTLDLPGPERPVSTERSREATYATEGGAVAGTPNYMPPEQAAGQHARIGPWTDVYALGAILYHVLADRPPYDGPDAASILHRVLTEDPPPPRRRGSADGAEAPGSLAAGLVAICRKAMARDIAERYGDASVLAEAVASWLDGARLREQAVALVAQADDLGPRVGALEGDLVDLRREAARLRADGVAGLRAAWDVEDRIVEVEEEAAALRGRQISLLEAALAHAPDLADARERLARLAPSPAEGPARLVLRTEPPVDVVARPWVRRERRLVPGEPVALGRAPIDHELSAGAWLLTLEAPGGPLPVPVQLGAASSSDGAGASSANASPEGGSIEGEQHPAPLLVLPAPLEPDACWVPGGPARLGGDIERDDSLPEQVVDVDGFVMARDPVTVVEYRRFLETLLRAGAVERARSLAPRRADGTPLWSVDGCEARPPGSWADLQPVRAVPFEGARAYAAWWADRTGRSWRLPTEHEWEKAARGVDGRLHPWGDFLDPSWCAVLPPVVDPDAAPAPEGPAPVGSYPIDESPYGVRGLGGNVRDWVITLDGGPPVVRGGWYGGLPQLARAALRHRLAWPTHPGVGFRLVRS